MRDAYGFRDSRAVAVICSAARRLGRLFRAPLKPDAAADRWARYGYALKTADDGSILIIEPGREAEKFKDLESAAAYVDRQIQQSAAW